MRIFTIVFVLILGTGPVKGTNYSIDTTTNDWGKAPCTLAAPTLIYNSSSRQWMVNKLPQDIHPSGVWIGYINTTVALEYIGCTTHVRNEPVLLNSVGDCHFICKGTAFAVQVSDVNINCVCVNTTDYLRNKSCTENCGQHFLCGQPKTSAFAIYNKTGTTTQPTENDHFCLNYFYAMNFTWKSCYNSYKRVLCRDYDAHAQPFARVHPDTSPLPASWSIANKLCFKNDKLPATMQSIRNSINANLFNDDNAQSYWTGIQVTYTLQKAESHYHIEYPKGVGFGYLASDGIVHFAKHGHKRSLCQNLSLDSSTTDQTRRTENAMSEESSAVAIGVGISIGAITIVAVAGVIVILHRRGNLSCCLDKKTIKSSENNVIDSNKGYGEKPEKPVHNYYVLEKVNTRESFDGDINTGDPNLKNREDDNYTSIEDTDETHTNVKENDCDYDYSSNGKAIKTSCYGPENVYNRLQLDRHGGYENTNGQARGMCNDVGNDYDTATGALPCMHKSVLGDDSDYNHINAASNYTQNRLNSSKDTPNIDYDVINGTKFTLHSADNAGYHHVEKKSSG